MQQSVIPLWDGVPVVDVSYCWRRGYIGFASHFLVIVFWHYLMGYSALSEAVLMT